MPATSAASRSGPRAPSLSTRARSAGTTGAEGWPLITVWVSSKSRACPAAPLTRAAPSRVARSGRPISVARPLPSVSATDSSRIPVSGSREPASAQPRKSSRQWRATSRASAGISRSGCPAPRGRAPGWRPRSSCEAPSYRLPDELAQGREVDGARVDEPLQGHAPQQREEHGGLGLGVDIGSNLSFLDSPADAPAGRRADRLVQLGEDAPQLGHRSEGLAHEDVEGPQALLAGGELAQIGVAHLAERLEPGAAFHGRHHLVLCETGGDPADQSAEQVLLRAEAVAHEPAAVARLLADLGQRGAAVALAGDQLDRRAQDELLREGGPLGLGAPARRLLRAPGGGSRVDRPRP